MDEAVITAMTCYPSALCDALPDSLAGLLKDQLGATTKPTEPSDNPSTAPVGQPGGLPITGASLGLPILAGVLLCSMGVVMLALARRRRGRRTAADVT